MCGTINDFRGIRFHLSSKYSQEWMGDLIFIMDAFVVINHAVVSRERMCGHRPTLRSHSNKEMCYFEARQRTYFTVLYSLQYVSTLQYVFRKQQLRIVCNVSANKVDRLNQAHYKVII